MFPSTTTESPSHRSLGELLRDALGTAIEFATLGEATLGPARGDGVRFVRPEEAAAASVPLPFSLFGDTTPRLAGADSARDTKGPAPATGKHVAPSGGRFAAPPADVREHPHRLALRRPSRPRRPGAVPAPAPVCTMPVAPAPAHRAPTTGAPAAEQAGTAHRQAG